MNPAVNITALLNGPGLAAPGGLPSIPTNPIGNAPLLLGTISTCMIIGGIMILIRFYTQLSVSKRFKIADYFILATFLIAISHAVFSVIALHHGWGAHQWKISRKRLFEMFYYVHMLEVLYGPLVLCMKTGIVLQYLRMFAPHRAVNPLVYYGSWFIITTSTVFYTTTTLLTVFACTPREKIWNRLYVGGHCIFQSTRGIVFATSIFNILSDVAILLLPVTSVWRLRIPMKRKVAIMLMFGTGLIACIASGMRAYYDMLIIDRGSKADISYLSSFTSVWSWIECTLGVIVACTLSIPKLVQAKGGSIRTAIFKATKLFAPTRTWRESDQNKYESSSAVRLSSLDSHK